MDRDYPAPAFQLDLRNQCLLRHSREIVLRPKTFGVLKHLVENSGHLVTREQLLDSVWPDSHVTDVVLNVSICELRKLFGDDPRNPSFIQTVHRRGYRLVGSVALTQGSA